MPAGGVCARRVHCHCRPLRRIGPFEEFRQAADQRGHVGRPGPGYIARAPLPVLRGIARESLAEPALPIQGIGQQTQRGALEMARQGGWLRQGVANKFLRRVERPFLYLREGER